MIGNISTPGGIRPVSFGAGIGAIGGDTYRQAVVNTGPVSYWRLGEASGTNAADEMGANNGTYVNSPTLGATGLLTGDSNTAMTLAGATQYADVAAMSFGDSASAVTLSAWIYPTDTSFGTLISWGGSGAACHHLFRYSGHVRIYFWDGALRDKFTVATPLLAANTSYHVVVVHTFAAKTALVYVNGTYIETMDLSAYNAAVPVASGQHLRLGLQAWNTTNPFIGTLDEPAIWNRALSAAEVAMLYAIGTGIW